jgi:hypothetical protein
MIVNGVNHAKTFINKTSIEALHRRIEKLQAAIELLADTIPQGRRAVADVSLPIAMDELRWRIVDIWRKQEGEESLFEGDLTSHPENE